MSHYTLDELLARWKREELTSEQIIGQLLQVVRTLEERVRAVERRVPAVDTTAAPSEKRAAGTKC